jgi:hypothetical protein
MGFLSDYVFYNSGNECPESFHIWSGLSLISSVLSHKVKYNRDYFTVIPNIYVCLIGDAGSGKTTAMMIAKKILMHDFPNIPLSASVTSREDVAKFMGSDDGIRTFRKPSGEIFEYHPFCFYVSEFENLLSVDLIKMTAFLVDTFDGEHFSTSFKNSGKDSVPFPYTTMLSCAIPEWVMRTLKLQIFTGGLGRRMIMVVGKGKAPIAHPKPPPGGEEALKRAITHLHAIHDESFQGDFSMTPEADKWWVSWYEGKESPRIKKPDDPVLQQFYSTKHIQVMKVAMLLAMEDYKPRTVIQVEDFERAFAMLDLLEPRIKEFSAGVGRNELAVVSVQFMDMLNVLGGIVLEKRMRARFFNECRVVGKEFDLMVEHLCKTDQIVLTELQGKLLIFSPDRYEEHKKKRDATETTPPVV